MKCIVAVYHSQKLHAQILRLVLKIQFRKIQFSPLNTCLNSPLIGPILDYNLKTF